MLDVVEDNLRSKFLEEKKEYEESQKNELILQRDRDKFKMKELGLAEHKNVLYPTYQFDDRLKIEREVNPPPASLFVGLGYN